MTTETVKTDRLAAAKEWLRDKASDLRDFVSETWPLLLFGGAVVALFGFLGHQAYSDWRYQTEAAQACSDGRADACKTYVTGETTYSLQQAYMLDYKLATGHELK